MNYERGNQLSCDFLTDETCNLTQTMQLVETAAGDLGNACLHRELSVQLDAKIANRLHWPNLIRTCSTSTRATVSASLSGNGIASAHLVYGSTQVSIRIFPRVDLQCGPVKSTDSLSNGAPASIGCRGAVRGSFPL